MMRCNKPRVLLDCDGVLADFIGGALRIVNSMFGTNHVSADVTEFDFAGSLGLEPVDAANVKRAIGNLQGFAASLAVLPGAIDGVRRLRDVADVYVVTAQWIGNLTWTHERERWLDRHFGIQSIRVIHTSAKYVCSGDVLVDDKTSTCEEWRAAHPDGIAVQWSTPHNRLDLWDGPSTSDWGFLINEIVMRRDRANATAHDIDDLGDGIVLGGEA